MKTLTKTSLASGATGAALFALMLANPALSQTASQVTQPSYAPPVIHSVAGGLSVPAVNGLDIPVGAEKLKVTLSGLVVQNGLPELAATTARIEHTLKGKAVTGAELFKAARALEEAYAREGFILVRISLPPQTIKNGNPLKLVVTSGYVEAIDTSALPDEVRHHIDAILAPLVGQHNLTKADLERRLLLAGDTPGVMLRSTLKPGAKPGATVVVVEGRYDAVTTTLTADNSLAEDLGRYTLGLGADFNSVFGLGDVVYLRLNGYPGSNDNLFDAAPRNRQIIAGITLPLGTDGAWMNFEGVDSRTHPTSEAAYRTQDHYQRLSAKLGYSLIRGRDRNSSSILGLDLSDEKQSLTMTGATSPFTEDRLRVIRWTQTGDIMLQSGAQLSGSVTASFGLDALGARTATADLPLSRSGAEPDFRKLEIQARYNQSFFQQSVHISLAGKAQTSFGDALTSSEQMGLGGFDWVSAYESGQIQGDAGAALRTEITFPITLPFASALGGAVAPYLFGAAGLAKLETPTAVEDGVTRAGAFGAGLRFALSQKASPAATTVTLEYAHGASSDSGATDRFNFRLIARF
ncbi:ShlB/FhaC/HecB family hemolysin secretion/activation protein [Allorhizobium pseudoryzae]|uniref:ShlB/FhaC/HecB family hemolysin secretion/activation protein n=1 Tax=Allorhizobium pseudoryzae TaxID=379684 RepID=UPI003CFF0AB8